MSTPRFMPKFKKEPVKQVVVRGNSVTDVATP
jgi:transposase-like protein